MSPFTSPSTGFSQVVSDFCVAVHKQTSFREFIFVLISKSHYKLDDLQGRCTCLCFYFTHAKRDDKTVLLQTENKPLMWIFNIASKPSGGLLWQQGCHGNGDWGYRGNDRHHGDCITAGYIWGIQRQTRSIFDHCWSTQESSVFLPSRVSCTDNEILTVGWPSVYMAPFTH